MRQAGVTLHRGVRASHCCGLSCCGAQAPGAQAQQLWLTGLVIPRHVGSSQTRARTHVPCIGRQILNHCATREALEVFLYNLGTSPLSGIWMVNMFSQSVACLFVFFTVSFKEQKFLILIKYNLLIFLLQLVFFV